jgi:hypothetical protein
LNEEEPTYVKNGRFLKTNKCFFFPEENSFSAADCKRRHFRRTFKVKQYKIIRGATALMNLGRLSSRRWQSFSTAPDGTGLTCGQHIESHSCIFSFQNRTVTSLFK